jgi:hypothetical protein
MVHDGQTTAGKGSIRLDILRHGLDEDLVMLREED